MVCKDESDLKLCTKLILISRHVGNMPDGFSAFSLLLVRCDLFKAGQIISNMETSSG
jgi:hypothetical protein